MSFGSKEEYHACRSFDFERKMYCFMPPFSSCDIKISAVSQCRIFVAGQYRNS